ncbi:helix-turn-helix transcriptional regulator [Niabella aurantiaca]|uniref:helix-turn-helix transcriptional regulator n=1 Tax=Niabella aurantiaca TaxID=379900 RepID=UPI000360C349|nr:helix-turn-helix domain-containing protein [Niabella aurantiaca]
MEYRALSVPPHLQPYVYSAVWIHRNANAPFRFNMLPRFNPAFIFSLKHTEDISNHYAGNEIVFKPCNIYFGGGGIVPSRFTIPAKMDIILILLYPQATGAFWQEDALHFFDRPDRITNAGQQLRILNDKVSDARSIDQKWHHIQQFLSIRLQKRKPHNFSYVQRAMQMIQQTSGLIDIKTLALQAYTSQRNLLDRFRQYTGTTPKQIASITRFNKVAKSYIINPDINALYKNAVKHRYHDPSHLYKDFNRYLLQSPLHFLAQDNEINIVV